MAVHEEAFIAFAGTCPRSKKIAGVVQRNFLRCFMIPALGNCWILRKDLAFSGTPSLSLFSQVSASDFCRVVHMLFTKGGLQKLAGFQTPFLVRNHFLRNAR